MKKKSFAAPPPVVVSTAPPETPAPEGGNPLVITIPENPTGKLTLDLTPWLGRGIDVWVHACASQLHAFLQAKSVETNTVVNYWSAGMRWFFEFLTDTRRPAQPALLEPQDLKRWLGWLSEQGWSEVTQKSHYDATKSVLSALVQRQVIRKQEGLFPANPFPGSNSRKKGQTPLSPGERIRVATALRDDLIAIHKGRFDGSDSSALVVHVLAIAIRCGANTTPLLEAARDCLTDHPFMPTMKRLALFKRRGNATKVVQLRYSRSDDLSVSVPMDGVALVLKALQFSEPLLAEAKPQHRNRLWLYRSQSLAKSGEVTVLSDAMLGGSIRALIARHDLRGDDGGPLKLTLGRLRKTVEMRLFDLSGGDLLATAALMGHEPQVADIHYLACTQQMRENATFVGEALPDIYRAGADEKVVALLPGKTPTGRCKDPYQGDRAPKNGSPCDNFFSCFVCHSYAITGSPDDLHRLFSFYYFLEREMHHAKTEAWRTQFRETMLLIDRFTADKFDAGDVAAARERALREPLRFWASYSLREEAADGQA